MAKKATDRKMDLYVDANSLVADHFSGVGHYTLGIISALDKIVGEDPLITLHLVVVEQYSDRLKKYDFKSVTIDTLPFTKDDFHGKLVAGQLPQIDTLLGAGVYFFPDFVTWPLKESRAITTIHDLSFEQVPQFVDDGNARFLRKAVKGSVKRADRIATVTESMRQTIATFYKIKDNRIIVTNNAVDTNRFYPRSKAQINRVKEKYKIIGNYILCVGNIEPRKNQKMLMEAYTKLPETLAKKAGIVLVGAGGWKNKAIYEMTRDLQKQGYSAQILEGKVSDDDLPALYSGALLSANPSFYEGFGMPSVESMACGVPVLVSNIPVMREVTGGHAIYVDPHDTNSIKEALKEALSLAPKDRRDVVDRGLQQARSYTWQASAATLVKALREVSVLPGRRKTAVFERGAGLFKRLRGVSQ